MERLIYNSREASQLLGISRSTLLRLTKANALRKVKISSRRLVGRIASCFAISQKTRRINQDLLM